MDKLAEEIDQVARSTVAMYVFGVRQTVKLAMLHRRFWDYGVLHDMFLATKIHGATRIAGLDELHDRLKDFRENEVAVHDNLHHLVAFLVSLK